MKKNLFFASVSAAAIALSGWAGIGIETGTLSSFRESVEKSSGDNVRMAADSRQSDVVYKSQVSGNIDPNLVLDDGTRIMGNITLWGGGPFTGVSSLRPVDGTSVESVYQSYELGQSSNWVYVDGKYYGSAYKQAFGAVSNAVMYVYDTEKWDLRKIQLDAQWYNVSTHLAYNPVDGKIYAVAYDGLKQKWLATLNENEGTYNLITKISESVSSMAFDAKGVLYAISYDGYLKTINLTTAESTEVGKINDKGFDLQQSMAFDYHTGKLYWIKHDDSWKISLNTIDPTNANVRFISELPADMAIVGLWVKSPVAEAKAPDTVEALTVDFAANGSAVATVNVKAPQKMFDGSALSGNVDVEVFVDGTSIKKQSVKAGETLSFSHDFVTEGSHKVSAIASNTAGNSPEGSITVFCGQDTPRAPENVKLSVDENGSATLVWDAVTAGVNNGYMDASQVKYRITRMPGNTVVAEDHIQTTFAEQLPDDVKRYSYKIEAKFGDKVSEESVSNSLVWGTGLKVPFETKMGALDFFGLCDVMDNDGDTFTFYETWGSVSTYMAYGSDYTADDWLITPPFYLEPGTYYYSTSFGTTTDTPHAIKFTMGRDITVEAQNQVIADYPSFTPADGTKIKVKKVFVVKEAGKYYFGINHYSHTDGNTQPYCSVYDFSIKPGPAINAPQQVTDLSAETYPKGELKNKITFTTPTKDYNNATLSALTKVEISDLQGNVVAVKNDVKPGSTYTVDVDNAVQGMNTYLVNAYNEAGGKGGDSEISVYAGKDLATAVTNLTYSVENNLILTMNWDFPPEKGQNGGYVDPNDVTFNVGRSANASGYPYDIKEGKGLTECTFTIEEGGMSSYLGDKQNLYRYGITPVTPEGKGEMITLNVLLGKPYQAPFKETFHEKQLHSDYWGLSLLRGLHSWNLKDGDENSGIQPYDSDNGMALFSHQDDTESQEALITPLFELRKMKNPVISFYMHHNSKITDGAMLSVQISKNDAAFQPLTAAPIKVNDGTTGWKQHKLSLVDYNDNNRLKIAFLGANIEAVSAFAIDNIEIYDDVETDLAVTDIKAPASIGMNEGGELSVTIQNKGLNDIEAFKLDLFADGRKVDEYTGASLTVNEASSATFKLQPDATMSGRNVTYEVRVNLEADSNDLNDKAEATVAVQESELPAPASVDGILANDNVSLVWAAPAQTEPEEISDSFEDYEAYAIDGVGSWKFVDADGQLSDAISNVNYPNATVAKSFQVWKTEDLSIPDSENWAPYSGKQCLICFKASGYYPNRDSAPNSKSDDWLISPAVVGGTTVTFYANEASSRYGSEKFEFMTSSKSQNPEDFVVLNAETVSEMGWKQYTYTLPEDARYFAIHCVTERGFALLIDDITYTRGYKDLQLNGYNIYRDNILINETPVAGLEYTDKFPIAGESTYGVSAVYNRGESPMTTWLKESGLDGLADSAISVIGVQHQIQVTNAAGLRLRVYHASGVLLSEQIAKSDFEKITVPQGIYIVSVADNAYKVIVK